MVASCAMKGCSNTFGLRRNIHFHAFPLTDSVRLPFWITAINRGDNWRPSKFTKICSDHFSADCYITGTNFRLKKNAVPNKFDPKAKKCDTGSSLPCKVKPKIVSNTGIVVNVEEYNEALIDTNQIVESESFMNILNLDRLCTNKELEPMIVDVNALPNVSEAIEPSTIYIHSIAQMHDYCLPQSSRLIQHKFTQTKEKDAPEKTDLLRRKIKTLQRLLIRRNRHLETLKNEIKQLKTNLNHAKTHIFEYIPESCPPFVIDLLKQQTLCDKKKKKGRRYTEEIKKFALTLHYCSPRAYEFVAQHIPLPNPRTIKTWLSEALLIGEDQLSPISSEDVVCVGEVNDYEGDVEAQMELLFSSSENEEITELTC